MNKVGDNRNGEREDIFRKHGNHRDQMGTDRVRGQGYLRDVMLSVGQVMSMTTKGCLLRVR